MKFGPTVLIDNGNIDRYVTGQKRLQTGQWVQFAWLSRRSRWIGVSKAGVIHAQHSGSLANFTHLAKNYRRVMS